MGAEVRIILGRPPAPRILTGFGCPYEVHHFYTPHRRENHPAACEVPHFKWGVERGVPREVGWCARGSGALPMIHFGCPWGSATWVPSMSTHFYRGGSGVGSSKISCSANFGWSEPARDMFIGPQLLAERAPRKGVSSIYPHLDVVRPCAPSALRGSTFDT